MRQISGHFECDLSPLTRPIGAPCDFLSLWYGGRVLDMHAYTRKCPCNILYAATGINEIPSLLPVQTHGNDPCKRQLSTSCACFVLSTLHRSFTIQHKFCSEHSYDDDMCKLILITNHCDLRDVACDVDCKCSTCQLTLSQPKPQLKPC